MSISAIGVGAGLEAVFHHHHRGQSATDASNQTSAGRSGRTRSQSASGDTVNQAQNALYALLSGLSFGTNSEGSGDTSQGEQGDMAPPPPPSQGGRSNSLGNTIATLLQSVESGDMTNAQSAATTLQSALDSATSASSGATGDSTATSSASSNSSQSTFLADLKTLLSAVQLGNATASKSAADTLITDIKNTNAVQHANYAYSRWS
jgi:hypothetical protein